MSYPLSQVTNSNSFGVLLDRTNIVLAMISSNVVTLDTSINGGTTTGNGSVNGYFGANTLFATSIQGGNLTTSNTLYVSSNLSVNAIVYAGNSTTNNSIGFDGNNTIVLSKATVNNYLQYILQNYSSGNNASTDYVLNADIANNTNYYLNLGINSSTYSNTQYSINGALDSYLYTSNGALAIGTASAKPLQLFANGTLANNEVMRIDSGGNTGFGNTTPNAKVQITGTANVSGNVNFGSSLNVTNTVIFANTLSVTGNTVLSNTLLVTGNTIFSNTITVAGNSNFSSITVSSNISTANLTATNAIISNLVANVITSGPITSNGLVSSNGMVITGTANVSSNFRVGGDLIVTGNVSFTALGAGDFVPPISNTYQVGNNTNRWISHFSYGDYSGNLAVTGLGTFSSNLNVTGIGAFSSNVNVSGTLNLSASGLKFSDSTTLTTASFSVGGGSNGYVQFYDSTTTSKLNSNSNLTFTSNNTLTLLGTLNVTTSNATTANVTTLNGVTANVVTLNSNSVVSNTANVVTLNSNSVVSNTHQYAYNTVTTGTFAIANTSTVTIDSFPTATFRSGEYTIQIVDGGTNYHVTKILVLHDGTTPLTTEYGTIYNNISLGVFSADINAGSVRIRLTPSVGSGNVKFIKSNMVL